MTNSTLRPELCIRVSGTGQDLVLLHGWGMNSGAFYEFLPYLTDSFRVTTIDLPGFGENADCLPDQYTLESLVDIINQALPEQPLVAGWSLGGLVAQQLCLTHSERIRGLITIASTPCFIAKPGWVGIAPDLLQGFEQQLEQDYAKTLDRFLAIQAMGSETARQDIKTIRKRIAQLPVPAITALQAGLGLLSSVDLRDSIGRIKQPTLRLYGRLDSLVPTSGIDRIHELQPNADTVVVPHASHAPFISHPQQTADIITHFANNLCANEICHS